MRPTFNPPARPGFWWSPLDPVMFALCGAATAWVWPRMGPAAGLILVVPAHYFLFCNVVRLRPRREAVWALAFLWVTAVFVAQGVLHWLPILAAILPVTVALVIEEIANPGYRGLGSRRS